MGDLFLMFTIDRLVWGVVGRFTGKQCCTVRLREARGGESDGDAAHRSGRGHSRGEPEKGSRGTEHVESGDEVRLKAARYFVLVVQTGVKFCYNARGKDPICECDA